MATEAQELVPPEDGDEGDGVGTPWEGLDVRQKRAAEAHAAGLTSPRIAHMLEVNRTTVWRWSQDERFLAYVRHVEAEQRRDSLAAVRQATHAALHAVAEAAASGNTAAALGWLRIASQHWRTHWNVL